MFIKILLFLCIFITVSGVSIFLVNVLTKRTEKVLLRSLKETSEKLDFLYADLRAEQILNYKFAGMLAGGFIGFLISFNLILALLLGMVGFYIPPLLLRQMLAKRLKQFDVQLVEAIELLANSMKSGLSLTQALDMVVKEMKPPISQEFEYMLNEHRFGVPLEDALQNLVERIRSKELALVVTAMNISRETGGNLAEVLKQIAQTIRDRNTMLGKIRAITAEGRFQGYFVGALPFVLGFILFLMEPELMRPMFTTAIGWILLAVVVVLVATGFWFIQKIVKIDV